VYFPTLKKGGKQDTFEAAHTVIHAIPFLLRKGMRPEVMLFPSVEANGAFLESKKGPSLVLLDTKKKIKPAEESKNCF
jgi:hypothetical protein